MFTLNNKKYICIVDYHSKFPIIKKTEDLSVDSLTLTCKIIFAEYGVTKKIMSDSGGNFISDKFKTFCKSLNIEQAFSSPYHHQSNGQMEACIKYCKTNIKEMFWFQEWPTHSSAADTNDSVGTRTPYSSNDAVQMPNYRQNASN